MILMASLPTSWAVVGCALIAVTLIAVVLFVLKAREVATLKKEVLELRDTMRMMRYEEANLSRMLHTADKYPEPAAQDETPEQEEPAAQDEEEIAEIAEMPETAETPEETESTEEPEETEAPEESEEPETPEKSKETEEPETPEEPEESEETESSKSSEPSEPTSEPELPEPPQVKEPPRKQAINERRPAIPTDLFAAWFEENELVQEEAPAEAAPVATEPSEKSEISENPEPTDSSETSVSPESSKSSKSSDSSESSDSSNSPEPAPQETATPVALSKEDERFCRKLERIVNSRMKNPNLNIDVIAAQFGIGRTNFYRKVRELMGVSPNDYLRKCRMERAAELLRDSELTIADVCARVGIPDAQYFSRVFKSHFGIPPSAYREQKSNG